MRQLAKWFLMLNKRLYKKATFVILLALIPVSVLVFSVVAQQDSGFLHIVLACTDATDPVSTAVVQELLAEDSLIRFTEAATPDEAVEAVKLGKADEAWLFPADMEGAIRQFAADDAKGFVTIVAREQTVLLRVSHEKLTAALYKYCAQAYYLDFTRTNVPALDTMSERELIRYFDEASISEELFVFGDAEASADTENAVDENYLTSPLRGLLGVLVVLCGMAATMYYRQDEHTGLFSWVPESRKGYVAFCCLMIAVLNVALAAWLSLFVAGLAGSLLQEWLILLLYTICCSVFCLVLGQLIHSIKLYGALIPLVTVIMIAVCPVFFDIRDFLGVQLLFPPTYYVNALYDSRFVLYMVAYAVAGLLLCWLLGWLRKVCAPTHRLR